MRTLQKVADLPEIQKRLGIKRFSLGSFSESCRVFEPEMLQEVVQQLAGERRVESNSVSLPGNCRNSSCRSIPCILQTLSTVTQAII